MIGVKSGAKVAVSEGAAGSPPFYKDIFGSSSSEDAE